MNHLVKIPVYMDRYKVFFSVEAQHPFTDLENKVFYYDGQVVPRSSCSLTDLDAFSVICFCNMLTNRWKRHRNVIVEEKWLIIE